MKIVIIGSGFVGVVSAAVYASFGHQVIGIDIDQEKVDLLNQGSVPFYEPGLKELLEKGLQAGNLRFTTTYEASIPDAQVIIIAVGTPSSPEGKADLSYVEAAVDACAPHLNASAILAVKSTVPPGIFHQLRERLSQKATVPVQLASLPEFLREGSAVQDTLKPDRVVIGAEDEATFSILRQLHQPLDVPMLKVTPESAQLGKYASNSYLALRIGFINQMADYCEKTGADIEQVIKIIGADSRIGAHYWYPGLGYGGSCYPKDVRELAYTSQELGLGESLFVKLRDLNETRPATLLERWAAQVGGWQGKTVAVLGLSFKPNTNDMREAPSLQVIPRLVEAGTNVRAYDPKALSEAEKILGTSERISYFDEIARTSQDADVIIALIEWPEITMFDFSSVNHQTTNQRRFFIDARNQFDPPTVRRWGYEYIGIGRPQQQSTI